MNDLWEVHVVTLCECRSEQTVVYNCGLQLACENNYTFNTHTRRQMWTVVRYIQVAVQLELSDEISNSGHSKMLNSGPPNSRLLDIFPDFCYKRARMIHFSDRRSSGVLFKTTVSKWSGDGSFTVNFSEESKRHQKGMSLTMVVMMLMN